MILYEIDPAKRKTKVAIIPTSNKKEIKVYLKVFLILCFSLILLNYTGYVIFNK
jgi:hypothetical protein